MNGFFIIYIIGYVLKIEGFLMLAPVLCGIVYGEQEALGFFLCAAFTFLLGLVLSFKRPKNQVFYAKEGMISVALSWIFMSLFGCIPFVLTGEIPGFTNAFFETVSGFTTTGSSILTNVEALSHCALLWRSFTHWIGGMGVLVFILSILPIGAGTIHLMRAESPGPQVEKIVPKMKDTSKILYVIYTAITIAEFIVLLICGNGIFDSLTTAFATAGTGGFAIRNSGFSEYSPITQYVVAVFMLVFGVNFNVYYLICKKHLKKAVKSEEFKWYLLIVALSTIGIALNIRHMFPPETAFRQAFFNVSSIITTTGFGSVDYNFFPTFSKQILLLLMFIGASAGSTGGGMKVSRIVILFKTAMNEISRFLHPRTVKKVRFEGGIVDHPTLRAINTYLVAYLCVLVVSVLIISLDGFDMMTTISSVVTTLNNIGPGFNVIGPAGNFSGFSRLSKLVCCFDMIAGRLEIFPMLLLISPATWYKPLKLHKSFRDDLGTDDLM